MKALVIAAGVLGTAVFAGIRGLRAITIGDADEQAYHAELRFHRGLLD